MNTTLAEELLGQVPLTVDMLGGISTVQALLDKCLNWLYYTSFLLTLQYLKCMTRASIILVLTYSKEAICCLFLINSIRI